MHNLKFRNKPCKIYRIQYTTKVRPHRHLFVADSLLMLVYIPLDIYWTFTRHSQAVCKLMKGSLFLVFFAACNFLIILAVDR